MSVPDCDRNALSPHRPGCQWVVTSGRCSLGAYEIAFYQVRARPTWDANPFSVDEPCECELGCTACDLESSLVMHFVMASAHEAQIPHLVQAAVLLMDDVVDIQ